VFAQELHRQAMAMVEKYGFADQDPPRTGAPMQSPYLPIVNKQAQIMLRAAEQLGFSSVSRSRVQVVEDPALAEDDPGARLG
jgi:hypothetical protein